MAITWRNVDAPDFTGANTLISDAADRIGTGFDGFRKVFDENTQSQQKALEQTKNYNTGQFLDRLAAYRDPAALEAAIQSGEIGQLRQQFGGMINQDQVRNAVDERGSFLRKDAAERMTFENTAQDHKDAPILNGLLAEARQIDIGDPKQVEAQLNQLEQKLAQSGLSTRGQATAAQGLVDIRKSLLGDRQTVEQISNARTQLDLEGRRVADMEANSEQSRKIRGAEHEWRLDARNAEILANKAIQQGGSFADVRAQVQQALPNAPIGMLNGVLDKAQASYTALTGRTPEQDEEMAVKLAPYEAEVAAAQQYLDSKPIFSQAINENMSESDAIGKVTELTPGEQDNTADQFRKAIKVLRKNEDLKIPEDANLGPVILAAAKMAGIDEGMIGDDHFNGSDLEKVLPLAYKEYTDYMKYQTAFKTAQIKLNEARQTETDRYKIRNALKPSAK